MQNAVHIMHPLMPASRQLDAELLHEKQNPTSTMTPVISVVKLRHQRCEETEGPKGTLIEWTGIRK